MFKKKVVEKTELTAKDVKEMLANCKVGKAADFEPITFMVESLPSARLKDKLARNHNYMVTASTFDPKTKSIAYEYIINVDDTTNVVVPYEQICEEFGWKSFTVSDNGETIYPKW